MRIVPLARKARELARQREGRDRVPFHPTRWLTLAGVFLLTVVITAPIVWLQGVPSAEGELIHEPIRAEVPFSYLSPADREAWTERRQRDHDRVFVYDSTRKLAGIERVEQIVAEARRIATESNDLDGETLRDKMAAVDDQFMGWSPEDAAVLGRLVLDERFREAAIEIVEETYGDNYVMTRRDFDRMGASRSSARSVWRDQPPPSNAGEIVYPDDTSIILRNLVRRRLQSVLMTPWNAPGSVMGTNLADVMDTPGAHVAIRLIEMGIGPNYAYSAEETKRAFDSYPPPRPTQYSRGALLAPTAPGVTFPHALTEAESHLLSEYGSARQRHNLLKFGAQVLFVLIAFLIISFFVIKFSRELEFSSRTVLLLAIPVLLALGMGRGLLLMGGENMPDIGYAFPAGVIGILGVLLLDVRLAILLVTWGCLLFGLEADLRYEFVIVGLFGGYTAVAALYTFRERREVLYAGLLIGVVNGATILIIHFVGDWSSDAWMAASIGAVSGVMCSLISFAVIPVFEFAFKITTDMRLLELSGLKHPLLRQLEERAPGTWQHTLNVTKLAEEAAEHIGVNSLLVRTGCYFHDIGKMGRPEYFTENQVTPEDKKRHESKKPQMSTLIIKDHVKRGIELADKYGLPPEIKAFIPEHHGTSLIVYFYHKALTAHDRGEQKEPVREEDYRYPGPKPQTIASALVMLADTVEATATAKLSGRAIREEEIKLLVRNAINEKFNDGQFDECNLTMRDLNRIRESFERTLKNRFHSRIDYPSMRREPPKKEKTEGDGAPATEKLVEKEPIRKETTAQVTGI
jgi:putative nucleotidyltransferase with HDIG domain